MSKPVTNVEIEDVLSSIRRLVSSSDRVERPVETAPEEEQDRLVLTPSLRVDDEAVEEEIVSEEQEVEENTSRSSEDTADATADVDEAEESPASDEEVLELVAQSSALEEDAEDADVTGTQEAATEETEGEDGLLVLDDALEENSENSLQFDSDELSEEELSAEFAAAEDEAEAKSHDADLDAELTDSVQELQKRAAKFEAVVAEREDQWDPDGTVEDDNAGTRVGPLPWDDQEEAEAHDTASSPDDEVDLALAAAVFRRSRTHDTSDPADDVSATKVEDAPSEDAAAEADDEGINLSDVDLDQVMAELVDATSDTTTDPADDAVEPVSEDDEATAEAEPAAFAFRDQDGDQTLTGDDPEAADTDTQAPMAIEEALLDEEALRDMVSDIVRQELQGALGERITRNVRKLVRREIHRALASQELE